LIAQNVHGSKIIKFEVSDQLQGKQWNNLILTSLNSNHKSDRVNSTLYLKELFLLRFFLGGGWRDLLSSFVPYFKFWGNVIKRSCKSKWEDTWCIWMVTKYY
jgi:hypothetical protein